MKLENWIDLKKQQLLNTRFNIPSLENGDYTLVNKDNPLKDKADIKSDNYRLFIYADSAISSKELEQTFGIKIAFEMNPKTEENKFHDFFGNHLEKEGKSVYRISKLDKGVSVVPAEQVAEKKVIQPSKKSKKKDVYLEI